MQTDFENEQLDELEYAPSADGNKCDHGVYLTSDERETRVARNCCVCNPLINRIIAPRKRVPELKHIEREMDTQDYLDQPVGARLAAAWRMEN